MVRKICSVLCGLTVGVLSVGILPSLAAEAPTGTPELLPIPAPQEMPPGVSRQAYPQPPSGPPQAGDDAYRRAEQARRPAIDRQQQLQPGMCVYNPWRSYVDRFALPYIHAYAPPRVAWRVQGALDRHLPGAVFVPQPRIVGGVNASPYSPRLQQPPGYEKARTSPNGSINGPRRPESSASGPVPTPAAPRTPPLAAPSLGRSAPPAEPLAGALPPVTAASGHAELEPIPAPPAESGPREF